MALVADVGQYLEGPVFNKRFEGGRMNKRTWFLAVVAVLASADALSTEGPVVWADSTCGYFIVRLPEGNPVEAYGLFRSNSIPIPKIGDVVEGDIVATYQLKATDKATGREYSLLHWANGESPEMLVRHSPVHCASRYQKGK
jgi:hypothetical protein